MAGRFDGKTILVTGGASGIGAACTARLRAEGANVVWTDLQTTESCAGKAVSQETGLFIQQDASRTEDWARVEDEIRDRYGRLDGLVNNAGIYRTQSIEDTSIDELNAVLEVNLGSVFLGCQTAIRLMKEAGGAIVNVSSIGALRPGSSAIGYGVSKAGVTNITQAVAHHCRSRNYAIRCNAICPGAVETPLSNVALGDDPAGKARAFVAKNSLLGRPATPAELAGSILFLLSDDAAYVTGAALVADGGRLL